MTIYSLDILLFLFGTSLLFYVQLQLLLPDLHTDFSRGRSGGLVLPSLSEFSTVYCDPPKFIVIIQIRPSQNSHSNYKKSVLIKYKYVLINTAVV